MNKFIENLTLSNSGVVGKRAEALSKLAKLEQETLVNNLQREVFGLQANMDKLTDLSPDNSYSLKPGGDNFDPEVWVATLQQTKLDLQIKELELQVAESTLTEWFGDSAEIEKSQKREQANRTPATKKATVKK